MGWNYGSDLSPENFLSMGNLHLLCECTCKGHSCSGFPGKDKEVWILIPLHISSHWGEYQTSSTYTVLGSTPSFPLANSCHLENHCTSYHLHVTSPVTSCLPDPVRQFSSSLYLPLISKRHCNTLLSFKVARVLLTVVTPTPIRCWRIVIVWEIFVGWMNWMKLFGENVKSRGKHWQSWRSPNYHSFPLPARERQRAQHREQTVTTTTTTTEKYFFMWSSFGTLRYESDFIVGGQNYPLILTWFVQSSAPGCVSKSGTRCLILPTAYSQVELSRVFPL